jgi:ketosteroid isomerase-like protein
MTTESGTANLAEMKGESGAARVFLALSGAVIQSADLDVARTFVTEGFQWDVMGRVPPAGVYRGVEGLAELLQVVRERSGNTFRMTPQVAFGDDDTAVIIVHATASYRGRTLNVRNIVIVECENGRVAHGWTVPWDQYTYDAFWE